MPAERPALRRLRTSPAALVLMGGGARAAYQVGVLKAIAQLLREVRRGQDPGLAQGRNPFPILLGTSAGAINASALAARADNFQDAVARLVAVWENFRAEQVYRSELLDVVRSGARWFSLLSMGWLLRRSLSARPRALLDNSPLRELLESGIAFNRIGRAIERGHLQALAISASSYSSGRHVTFYQSAAPAPFRPKLQQEAVRAQIDVTHLLASSAIPFVFPAMPLELAPGETEYFGDGAMRQLSPTSPAIHLGAERILVVGVGQTGNPGALPGSGAQAYPSLAQVVGHALSSIFLDALPTDVERLEKFNQVARALDPASRQAIGLRAIETLVISPSQRIDALAVEHAQHLPGPVRRLLEGLGAQEGSGAGLVSYLLFEAPFTRALIELGMEDTLGRRDEVLDFLTTQPAPSPLVARRVQVE
jgi:NTE family protein